MSEAARDARAGGGGSPGWLLALSLGCLLATSEAEAGALLYKKGSFTKTNAVATQAITGVGFQPKAVVFFWTRQPASQTDADVAAGYGFTTGAAANRAIAITVQSGISPANTLSRQSQTYCIVMLNVAQAPALRAQASLSTFDPDGFTLNWVTNNTPAALIHYIALGGPELTNTLAGSFTPTASTGAEAFGTVGFQPDFLMLLSIDSATPDTDLNNAQASLGFAAGPNGSITQGGLAAQLMPNGSTTGTNGQQRTDSALMELNPAGGAVQRKLASVQSFDPGGFTINKSVAADSTPVHFLALKGGLYKVGSFDKTASTTPPVVDQAVTGVGFQPMGLLLASRDKGAFAGINSEAFLHLGAADETSQGATSIHNNNCCVLSAMRTSTLAAATFITTASTVAEARRKSFDADGFTLTWTSQTTTPAREVLYAAFGPAPTVVSYSVGTSGANFRSSPALTLSISAGTATFSEPQANNVGVGDKVTYNGSTVAYIARRYSSTSYKLISAVGATAPNVGAGTPVDSIMRAFNSLTAANAQSADASHLNLAGPPYDLVAANIQLSWPCYNDGPLDDRPTVSGWTTGPANFIRIYAPHQAADVGARQRHSGVEATGFRLAPVSSSPPGGAVLGIDEEYVRVEGIEVDGSGLTNAPALYGIFTTNTLSTTSDVRIDACIVHDLHVTTGITQFDLGVFINGTAVAGARAKISNNLIYDLTNTTYHVLGIGVSSGTTSYVYNNTVYHIWQTSGVMNGAAWGISARGGGVDSIVYATNNFAGDVFANADVEFCYQAVGAGPPTLNQTTNVSSDNTGTPVGLQIKTAYATYFVNPTVGSENLHLKDRANVLWGSFGTDLLENANLPITRDTDFQARHPAPDHGADEFFLTTAVQLVSFDAAGRAAGVDLTWRTASELQNLGFHVYRGSSADGPWTRLTTSLIPGLGSSAIGQGYSFHDSGLVNGTRYFYRLEDVDASSKITSHGPVSAVPTAGASARDDGAKQGGRDEKKSSSASSSCPDWVLSAYASAVGADAATASLRCTRHGDPEASWLGVLSRDSRQATLELQTRGFYALHEPSGTVRVFVPGFDFPQDEQAAALPIRRALTDAVVGRRVQLGGVRALELVSFKGLVPSSLGKAEMQVSRDGTVRAARRGSRALSRLLPKSELVTLLPSLFQGEQKSAVVEIAPLRFDAQRRQLVLAKRVRVKLLFTGREMGESGRGSLGRAQESRKPVVSGEVLARLHTTSPGLHAVSFEQLFPGQRRGFTASQLRLERQGEPVGFHLEPSADSFGPGSRLYFHADKAAASTDFSAEVAYELVRSAGGVAMPLQSAAPGSNALASASLVSRSFETDRLYQPGLLDAADPWLWEPLASGATRLKSFALSGVSGSGEAELDVFVQGASESGQPVDHHVTVSLNGTLVGAAQFAGKKPYRMSLSLPASVLREGANDLSLTNVGDTGVTSLVFLDRFTLAHPQAPSLTGGRFEGTWSESGTVSVAGLGSSAVLLDVTAGAQWLTGYQVSGGSVRFQATAGHRYLVASQEALIAPRVAAPEASTLRAATNQADYILIASRAFLAAAEPLIQRRQDQGLTARAVAFEEIATEFGHGQASAEAIKSFLAYAFHSWTRPSPRYVLLLGDASYDPRNLIGTSQPSPLPALWAKTSYLWTVSDPQLAAVNGEDSLPDLAIGRLPAATVEQAEALVAKLLAWEDSGQGLSGQAALVADNPDIAGDFEADVQDVATSFLAGRHQLLLLRELGSGTRPAILDALNSGLSYLSYVGHGGAAVWASENVWNSWDAPSLLAQSQQPLLVTMNCLNGYFVAPSFDSLSESLLKAEGRGAIASFSPSGLSLDGPAHQYHRALMGELTSGRHKRLGDAVLAAQRDYVQTGLMPELLGIYQLLGDPALVIGPR